MRRNQTAFIAVVNMNDIAETELFNWSDSAINANHPDQSGRAFFEPCILKIPTYTGRVGLDIWGNKSTSSITNMVISGIRYPYLHKDSRIRDASIEFFIIKRSAEGGTSFQSVFKGVIDSVKKSGEDQLLTISSRMAELDKAANQHIFDTSTPHSAIHYRNAPMCIGKALACPLISTAPILDEFVGCNSDIVAYMDVFDNGDRFNPFDPDFDWTYQWNTYANGLGLKLGSPDYGVITADIDGAIYQETLDSVNFFQDFAGYFYPTITGSGWEITIGKTGTVVNDPTFYARLARTGAGTAAVRYLTDDLLIGKKYRITLDMIDQGAGSILEMWTGNTKVLDIPIATGSFTFDFWAYGEKILFKLPSSGAVDVSIGNNMQLKLIEQVGTSTLVNFCKHLLLVAGEIDTSKVNWQSFEDVQTDKDYEIGYFTDKSVNVQTVLNEVNKTFNSWVLESSDGKLTMNYLKNPSGQTPVFEINSSNIAGKPKVEPDWAKGLKDRIGVRKNYYVFDEDRIADIVTPQVKALLTSEFRRVRRTSHSIHSFYSHAISNCHKETLLHDTGKAVPEIDSVCVLYQQIRYFTEIPVTIDEMAIISLEYGDFIEYDGAIYVLVGKKFEYADNIITLTLWN